MRMTVLAVCALLVAPHVIATPANAIGWTLNIDACQRPREARCILAQPSLRAAVQSWLRQAEHAPSQPLLVITHRDDKDGTVWAGELRDWLVALAIPGNAILLRPGDVPAGSLRLFVESR